MRHKKSFNHLGRTASHRRAMMSNMAASLIMHKRITTTLAKAKALRGYVEPLITKSKEDTTHSRRVVFSYLQDKEAVTELFREVSQKVADRPGGYTRIIKLGTRLGDNADMALMELVDYNENLLADKVSKKTKTTRRRRGSKPKSTSETTPVSAPKATVKEEVKEETPATPEVKEEEPKAEVKEEPKGEVKEEPKAEVKEEPKAEVKDEHQEAPEKEKKESEHDENEHDKGKE